MQEWFMSKERNDDQFGLRPPGENTEPIEVVGRSTGGPYYAPSQQPNHQPPQGYQPPPGQSGQPGQPLPGQRGRTKRRHPVRKTLITILVILLVLLLAGGGYAWWLVHKFDSKSQTIENALPDYAGRPAAGPGENILLLGSDTRAESSDASAAAKAEGRTDTMMFVHVPKHGGHVTVTSIMRDTWVTIPGHGEAKINAAFSYGGVPLAARTVEELLDVRVDHVATIDFSGFEGLVNALGGVTVDVPHPFDKAGTHYEGRMKLTGEQALWFARERHAFKDGDYQRVKDQQILIKAILAKTASPATILNPVKMTKVVDNFSPYIGVDEGLSGWELVKLGWGMRSASGGVKMFTLPNKGTGWAGSQSIVLPDMAAIDEFGKALRNDDVDAFMKAHKLG
jgi:LCP family protein required for cell wall assembly